MLWRGFCWGIAETYFAYCLSSVRFCQLFWLYILNINKHRRWEEKLKNILMRAYFFFPPLTLSFVFWGNSIYRRKWASSYCGAYRTISHCHWHCPVISTTPPVYCMRCGWNLIVVGCALLLRIQNWDWITVFIMLGSSNECTNGPACTVWNSVLMESAELYCTNDFNRLLAFLFFKPWALGGRSCDPWNVEVLEAQDITRQSLGKLLWICTSCPEVQMRTTDWGGGKAHFHAVSA